MRAPTAIPVGTVEPSGTLCGDVAAAPSPQPWLTLRQAEVRLGARAQVQALRGVDLTVRPGERVALVGSNGSGKSSLLRALHGLQPLHAGAREAAPGLRIAMLFQRPHMLRLSVWRNVALGLWLAGWPWTKARARSLEALAHVDLAGLAERPGRALSGGQQQRLALARAWALAPDLWLLDEPTASLDPHAKREVEALLDAFGRAPAADRPAPAMVLASHNLGQVKRLASRVVYLEQGRVLADLPVDRFFDRDLLEAHSPQASAFVQGETA